MYTIAAQFQRFGDVHLSELIGAVGIYVIWDAHAKARPTYIGEGNILKRFADHVQRDDRRFALPWNGYVAIISGSTRSVHKDESKAVEFLLLAVAEKTDRLPIANICRGEFSVVRFLCEKERTLRIAISGYDPLLPPTEARPLPGTREIKARIGGAEGLQIEHPWRLRRLRAPVV